MAFTLETIFASRPAGQSSEPGNGSPKAEGKGADFAKNLSGHETGRRDKDEPALLTRADAGQVAAGAILINDLPKGDNAVSETLTFANDATPFSSGSQHIPAGELPDAPDTVFAGIHVKAPETPPGQMATVPVETSEAPLEQPTAGPIKATEALLEQLSAQPVAAPEAPREQPAASPVKTTEAPLEQLAAEPVAAPEAARDQVAADPAAILENSAAKNASGTDADTVKRAPPVPSAGPAAASSFASENADTPPEADNAAPPGKIDPALQSALASAISQAAVNAEPKAKDAVKPGAVALAPSPSNASPLTGDGTLAKGDKHTAKLTEGNFLKADTDQAASALQAHAPESVADAAIAGKVAHSQDMAMAALSAMPQSQPAQVPGAPVPSGMTPTHSLISATPAQVVEIVSDALAAPEDRKDRIVIQLDPPELGRVSIDFKFDANGLQHVTVTGETPEAIRHLRAMHFELVNALERQGLSSQNMSFQQQQAQQDPGQHAARPGRIDGDIVADANLTAPALIASRNSQSRSASGGGLNIKL